MPTYEYTTHASKAAKAKAAAGAARRPRRPDVTWQARCAHMRTHLTVLRNATTTDAQMRAHLDDALQLLAFTVHPSARELRDRFTLITRRLEHAFKIRDPKEETE